MGSPNFFIIGAPKAGTTALAEYLGAHAQVFMCPIKEPHFFSRDFDRPIYIQDEAKYLSLFSGTTKEHLAIGEASVWYLYSAVAVESIQKFNPDARIIVMVRNPLELVPSLHSQLLFSNCEDQKSFRNAWKLQQNRLLGKELPKSVLSGRFPASCLQYAKVASMGEQLERVLKVFPSNQVKTIVFDDFKSDPGRIYQDTLSFLGVPFDGRTSFPRVNENKVRRISWLSNPINNGSWLGETLIKIRKKLGLEGYGIIRRLSLLNSKKTQRTPLAPDLAEEFVEVFRTDVEKLGRIIDRDLSHWLLPRGGTGSRKEPSAKISNVVK